jgi:hypothetical protein
MTAYVVETARRPMRGDAVSGGLLALGAAALFVGTLFYARLTPELGLPALPAERAQGSPMRCRSGPSDCGSLEGSRSSATACCLPLASPWLQGTVGRRAT